MADDLGIDDLLNFINDDKDKDKDKKKKKKKKAKKNKNEEPKEEELNLEKVEDIKTRRRQK